MSCRIFIWIVLTCLILANDVMSYFNLLYVAKISGRTAVLPPFAPSHLGSEAGYINFGEVFDIPRLSALMNVPIIEWRDIKNENSTVRDEIGCWSIWSTSSSEHRPRGNPIEPRLNLDVSYTGIPESAVLYPQIPNDPHVKFWSLATITFPTGRANAHLPSEAEFPSRYSGHRQLPDEQMACFPSKRKHGHYRSITSNLCLQHINTRPMLAGGNGVREIAKG